MADGKGEMERKRSLALYMRGDQQSDDWTTPLGQAARLRGQNDFGIRGYKRKEADDGSLPPPLPSRKRGWTWTPSFPSCPGSQGQPELAPPAQSWMEAACSY